MNSYMENYILDINPIAFSIGPINVYWYGLAYMAGMVLGLFYALKTVSYTNLTLPTILLV